MAPNLKEGNGHLVDDDAETQLDPDFLRTEDPCIFCTDPAQGGIHHDQQTVARFTLVSGDGSRRLRARRRTALMGSETLTNASICNAGPTSLTTFLRRIPISMTRKIYTARKPSRKLRELKAESLDARTGSKSHSGHPASRYRCWWHLPLRTSCL